MTETMGQKKSTPGCIEGVGAIVAVMRDVGDTAGRAGTLDSCSI